MHEKDHMQRMLFRNLICCSLCLLMHYMCNSRTHYYRSEIAQMQALLKCVPYAQKNRQHSTFVETLEAAADYVCVRLISCVHHKSAIDVSSSLNTIESFSFCIESATEKNLYEYLDYVFERFDGIVRFDSIVLAKVGDSFRCDSSCSVLSWDGSIMKEVQDTNLDECIAQRKAIFFRYQYVDPWRECFWQKIIPCSHRVVGVVDGCGAVIDEKWYSIGDFFCGYLLKRAEGDSIVLRKYHTDFRCDSVFEI